MSGPDPGFRPLTLTELLQDGPLADIEVHGPVGAAVPVTAVRIVDRLAALDEVRPRSAVVLTAGAAAAAWTVEMALRKAWEQAAACVVVSREAGLPGSVAELAGRLGIPFLVVPGDPLDAAVRIASAVARPEAGRTALIAGAARQIAGAGIRPARLLSALHAVLPATSVALTGPSGELLAGRAGALDPTDRTARVTVEVAGPGGEPLAVLTARFRARPAGWEATVREVLGLAVAPLTAWAATERLAAERDGCRASGLLAELLARYGDDTAAEPDGARRDPGERRAPAGNERQSPGADAPRDVLEDPTGDERQALGGAGPNPPETGAADPHDPLLAAAVALGWPLRGPFVVHAVRPFGPAAPDSGPPGPETGPLLAARWARAGTGAGPLIAYEGVWVAWESVADPDGAGRDPLARAERRLRAACSEPGLPAPSAGAVAGPVASLGGLGQALADAVAAVGVARPGTVVRADRIGPAQLLTALPREALRAPARALLAPLLAVDRDGSLLRTLAVLLDVGGAPSVAAARLGVHRNTVSARLERLRALGCDPDDPGLRLPLHLACRVQLDATEPEVPEDQAEPPEGEPAG
ncbi:helix-turn-helix domain-containing protein [Streptomyces sp. G2]|uniref:helix-turn-helix domain-containing protein n=1 Tax=Streptomyces TaxID=1883 RepID=UPI00202EEFC0|nr:helix-turn-helix domain-containing protein [Streptomyces sp. G2]MCM1949088.1 helix-turn-helix domain-containing protein [Streptomyces sp. G2]